MLRLATHVAQIGGAGSARGVVLDMGGELKRGDRVRWTFRGRDVVGRVQRRITRRIEVDGRIVAGSRDDPRYVVRSDKSGGLAVRRAATLTRLDD